MIRPEERFFAGSGSLDNGGPPYTWHITDYDQRRHFSVTYDPSAPVKDVEETEEICMVQLRKHVDRLGPGVYGIHFTEPEEPITISTDPEDDVTWYINCYPLKVLALPFPIKTIYLADLTELDRLGPQVDLVSYQGTPCVGTNFKNTTAVFKYWFMHNGWWRTWYELNSWSRLPRDHPHIVPFDSVVLDNITGTVVGFTSLFILGGTLKDNNATTRPFQDNLRIFDFNYFIMIGEHYTPHRDDVKGVIFTLYEIITLDEHFREVPHEQQDADAVQQLQWTKHPEVQLDTLASHARAPPASVPRFGPGGEIAEIETKPSVIRVRNHLLRMGEPFWNWERPARSQMVETHANGDTYQENGEGSVDKETKRACKEA
ncbi:protein kinase [Achaetomium macrosporum]|uniref:Protein kinase n=1 Tax=Achaetomium macrosporum TaxID=79813 RepID=A0AAN7H7N6_9PEZI|nr:protein kinase [Achaetomium macrosporum]